MPHEKFNRVDTLLVDPDIQSRNLLHKILRSMGFQQTRLADTVAEMNNIFRVKSPDLLIVDANLPDGSAGPFIHEVRHHVHGGNPFVPIICLMSDPNPDRVKRVVNAGADDLLVRPLSRGHLTERIRLLIHARKPFMVTTDYIGPDRRKAERRQSDVHVLDVPNSLRAKAVDGLSTRELQAAILEIFKEVNLHKLERHADQIAFLCERLVPKLRSSETRTEARPYLDRLLYVTEDSRRRLGGTKYDHVSELCGSLIKVTQSLIETVESPDDREIRLLESLSQAIGTGFETGTAVSAREIAASIGT